MPASATLQPRGERLRIELGRLGLHAFPSAANFVLFECPTPAEDLAAGLRERGVAVRAFPALGSLGDCVRVTIGPWPLMQRLLDALADSELGDAAALRRQLERLGHFFDGDTDAEIIAHAYEQWGESCIPRLRGMFAFALWDANRRRCLLARDRLGIKPLYYACTDRELVFASEIKGIVASGALKPVFNEAILPEYLANRYVAGEETFYHGVMKLLPGHLLEWSAEEGCRVRRYWHPPRESHGEEVPLSDRAEQLRAGLARAVQSHLMSDVPLGLFLSGGLDSSYLTALAAQQQPGIAAYTLGFRAADAKFEAMPDHLYYARMLAERLDVELHEIEIAPNVLDLLPQMTFHLDEPIGDPAAINTFLICSAAREAGVKVMLSGMGADEIFFGYRRQKAWLLAQRYQALPKLVRRGIEQVTYRLPVRVGRRSATRRLDRVDHTPAPWPDRRSPAI